MGLTKNQSLVVNTRGKNILVSAAAGSGKTRVLVQRIIEQLLDEDNPIDVDRILVVTFTNAAAAEMKERIRKKIDEVLVEYPTRSDLRKQATLIHNAQIRTIDSFCSWVVKNYFYEIDQDPSFRIGSKGELSLLSDQVLDDIFSNRFENKDENFIKLSDAYISGKNVDCLKEMILSLYRKAMSSPWPKEWFEDAIKSYSFDKLEEFEKSSMIQDIFLRGKNVCLSCAKKAELILNFYDSAVSDKSKAIIEYEAASFYSAARAESINDFYTIIAGIKFDTYRTSEKALGINKSDAKKLRDEYKAAFVSMRDKYFFETIEETFDRLIFSKSQAFTLIELTIEYFEKINAIKKKKNIYDFNDIEHMALQILRNENSNDHEKRPVAIELTDFFQEIMVDEYQDSNGLQEAILTAVCKDNNYFTVGDVKQSIYAFRQADPAIFMDKFNSYPGDGKKSVRIDLDMNFRSRYQVLDFCNQIFAPLMQADMGNVVYDEAAALKVGVSNHPGNMEDYLPEIYIASTKKDEMRMYGIGNNDEFEAHIIANRIQKLIKDNFMVCTADPTDESKTILRPIKLSDIVILMRATSQHADSFVKILREYDIPSYVESETGFFDRDEIQTVLSMLEVIDNPNNDISLAAALHSKMFDISSEQLALIRTTNKDENYFNCLKEYAKKFPEDKKIARFMDMLSKYRNMAYDTPIHELLSEILKDTGFDTYISALPMGQMAYANINKLLDEAVKFESSGNKSIAKFVSYINNLKTYQEELGLAKTVSENDLAVRIMTIHKSKGLEFPVVFLARCAGDFKNGGDSVYYHPSIGIGLNYKNPDTRVMGNTLLANIIKENNRADSLGEEIRILYVALTRAKEKLILIGQITPTKDNEVADIVEGLDAIPGQVLSYDQKANSRNYLEWVIRALRASQVSYKREIITSHDLVVSEASNQVSKQLVRDAIGTLVNRVDTTMADAIKQGLEYEYLAANDSKYKQKYSVSEIKHAAMAEKLGLLDDSESFFTFDEEKSYIPSFALQLEQKNDSSGKIPSGALYGTAMHRVCQCFDFSRDDYADSLKEQLAFMEETKSIGYEETQRINVNKLETFIKSELAARMHIADTRGGLYKEQPFVLGTSPKHLFNDDECEDTLTLVQGIIDVFFIEDDGIVLMDYKTDRVDESKELVLRYEEQLRLYQMAIEKAFDMKVKEILIYSFCLNETIKIGV